MSPCGEEDLASLAVDSSVLKQLLFYDAVLKKAALCKQCSQTFVNNYAHLQSIASLDIHLSNKKSSNYFFDSS